MLGFVQAAGPFPKVKGSRILHDKLREFIQRNYLADDRGRWFFQNGPQRVYVTLAYTPLVYRFASAAVRPLPEVSVVCANASSTNFARAA